MFLTPETTFAISVNTEIVENDGVQIPTFSITEGGSIQMRTATGRELANVLSTIRDPDAVYSHLEKFIMAGIDKKKIEYIHPKLSQALIQEVMKRSRVSEEERGK